MYAAESADRHSRLDENFARQAKDADHRASVIEKEAIDAIIPVMSSVAGDMIDTLINVKVDYKQVEKLITEKFAQNQ